VAKTVLRREINAQDRPQHSTNVITHLSHHPFRAAVETHAVIFI
jgi:hypothetical protein